MNVSRINLAALADQLKKYENKWIAISEANKIVSSGTTYQEARKGAKEGLNIALFKVPRLDAYLAP